MKRFFTSRRMEAAFFKELNRLHELYDGTAHSLRQINPYGANQPEWNGVPVHTTRESLEYALALLDGGEEEYFPRAFDIIRAILPLQDARPDSATFGVWPYYVEEPLEKMRFADPNWACFCGKQLVRLFLHHADRIPSDLWQSAREALVRACRSIVRRDVNLDYTNIVSLSIDVTLLAGELLENADIFYYGKQKLRDFLTYTEQSGGFTEYNSPTYTLVSLYSMTYLSRNVRDGECAEISGKLENRLWREIAEHFHKPTAQWGGPHSRAYQNTQGALFHSLLYWASEGKIDLVGDEPPMCRVQWPSVGLRCPGEYIPYFTSFSGDRTLREVYVSEEFPCCESTAHIAPGIATLHMTERFALGSFFQSDMFRQRHALIAYFGSARQPGYMRLRTLHDGRDFSSAILSVAQSKGSALCAVGFLTDGGDYHPIQDRLQDGLLAADDIRVRLEVCGADADSVCPEGWSADGALRFRLGGTDAVAGLDYAAFGNGAVETASCTENGGARCYDAVLYGGNGGSVALCELSRAVCVMSVSFGHTDAARPVISVSDGALNARWDSPDGVLELSVPSRPYSLKELQGKS